MSNREQGKAIVYTPSIEDIWGVVLLGATHAASFGGEEIDEAELRAMFDRTLAEVAAKALEDAAEHITDDYIKRAILARAEQIRKEGKSNG